MLPHPAIVKLATSIQPVDTTVIFVTHDPTTVDVFVSRMKMTYPRIRRFIKSGGGFHWTVIDEDPSLWADASGGGGMVSTRRKTLPHYITSCNDVDSLSNL